MKNKFKQLNLEDLENLKVGDEIFIVWHSKIHNAEYMINNEYEIYLLNGIIECLNIIKKYKNKHSRIKYKFSNESFLTINTSISKSGIQHYHTSGENYRKSFFKQLK